MSAKVHLHMHVSDLGKSRVFYEKFLGADPVKIKPGYVKFLPDWAPVNLALSAGGADGEGTVNHVGAQADAAATVLTPLTRARSAAGADGKGTWTPVGVQVDAVDTVMPHLARVKAAGLPVREEMGVDCCHANPDKLWVRAPARGQRQRQQ